MFILKRTRTFMHSTAARLIASYYFIFTIVFAVLLWMPFSLQEGVSISFLDAFFTATSGLSATGLATVRISETFSPIGLFLLTLTMQIGGLGITMLSTVFWLIAKHKISTRERYLIMTDQNQINLSGVVKLVKSVIISFTAIQLIFTLILGHYFYFNGINENYWAALFHGLFATTAATTNVGYDLTGQSLIPFRHHYLLQVLLMFLMFFGMMGFPVILEIKEYFIYKRKKKKFKFSIYTKITMATTFLLWGLGIIGFYIFEYQNFLADKGITERFFYATFHSLTTRNAGLVTTEMTNLSASTLILFAFLMIIGASPNSTGGGIRTTTFAIICAALFSFSLGKEHVNMYGREIEQKTVYKAFMIFIFATFTVGFVTMVICATDSFSFLEIFFEVASAFGTTGLSLGITPYLTPFAKILLIITMFIGRIGILTALMLFRRRVSPAKVRYPKTDLIIG